MSAQEAMVVLRFSDAVQTLCEQQEINIYEELQQVFPDIRIRRLSDPDAFSGSRDATTVLLAVATLVGSIAPVIIRVLNQFTPPNLSIQWRIEEQETRNPDGSTVVHRIYVSSNEEQRPWAALPYPPPISPQLPPSSRSQQEKDQST